MVKTGEKESLFGSGLCQRFHWAPTVQTTPVNIRNEFRKGVIPPSYIGTTECVGAGGGYKTHCESIAFFVPPPIQTQVPPLNLNMDNQHSWIIGSSNGNHTPVCLVLICMLNSKSTKFEWILLVLLLLIKREESVRQPTYWHRCQRFKAPPSRLAVHRVTWWPRDHVRKPKHWTVLARLR